MYKKLIIDADTILIRASLAVQQNYIVVSKKNSDKQKEFRNKTEFYGKWQTKDGGWLKEMNEFFGTVFSAEDFDIEECARLSPEVDDPLREAERQFDFFVGGMKKINVAEDYVLVFSGGKNFRYDVAKRVAYKSGRREKPLIFQELKDLILNKYKNRVVLTDGIEADDYCSIKAWEGYKQYQKTKSYPYCIAFVDKDLKMLISPSINYDKKEEGVKITTPEEAAKAFATQLLTGDITDSIPGLPNLTDDVRKKYGIRKSTGVGSSTAEKLLEGCTIKEMFERVVEAYRAYYGDESKPVTIHTGEIVNYSWMDHLQETARLLWMLRTPDEVYDVRTTLDKLKIKYD